MSRYIVNGEVYIEHRFLKKTIKIEDGKLTILPPDARFEKTSAAKNSRVQKNIFEFSNVLLIIGPYDTAIPNNTTTLHRR